jgi:predicted DNA-binding protein with PD1-like motif
MKVIPLRLPPGADLRRTLEAWMAEQQEQAGCVISAVGSLSVAQIRLAGAAEATAIHGELEILSLSGTLSPDGAHLHIAVADRQGSVIGGHLCVGSLVRTTAELVIGLLPEWRFNRELDPATGYAELAIKAQPERQSPAGSPADPVVAAGWLDPAAGMQAAPPGRRTCATAQGTEPPDHSATQAG